MKSTLFTRSITPEQKNLLNKDRNSKPNHMANAYLYNDKQKVAFLNKEIFSNQQRLANYNLKPSKIEKTVKVKKVSPSPISHNIKNPPPPKSDIKCKQPSPNRNNDKADNQKLKDQNNLFKYLLNNTNNKNWEAPDPKEPKKDNSLLKTEPKKTKLVEPIQESPGDQRKKPVERHYEQLLDQIKEEKKAFYQKLNAINNRQANPQNGFNDSLISNSFLVQRSPDPIPEMDQNQVLNSSEIEKATMVKLIEELEKNRRDKEEDLRSLSEKLEKQDIELSLVQKSHLEIAEGLNGSIEELQNENQALDLQIEKARRNLKEQEKAFRETQNLIEAYKFEINEITVTLHKNEKDSEKELTLLELKISNENSRNLELTQKLQSLQINIKNNEAVKDEHEKLQQELKDKDDEIEQLEAKKNELLTRQNDMRVKSQEETFRLKEELIQKTQSLHQMKNEFEELCKTKEKEKQSLQNELLYIESEISIIEKTQETERKEMNEKLAKISKENDDLEKEMRAAEIEHENKMKEIQKELEELDSKSRKIDEEIKSLDDLKNTLQMELNSSKKIFEDQIKQVEKENLKLEEQNQALQRDIEKLKAENFGLERELLDEKKTVESSLDLEIEKANKEIDDYKYMIDNLTKSKEDLEREIEEMSSKLKEEKKKKEEMSSQEKEKIKIIAKLKNELQDLQKINEENNNLLKKMLEEKEQNENELNELNMVNSVFQKEMQNNLETINEMSQKETSLNNKIKVLEAELKKYPTAKRSKTMTQNPLSHQNQDPKKPNESDLIPKSGDIQFTIKNAAKPNIIITPVNVTNETKKEEKLIESPEIKMNKTLNEPKINDQASNNQNEMSINKTEIENKQNIPYSSANKETKSSEVLKPTVKKLQKGASFNKLSSSPKYSAVMKSLEGIFGGGGTPIHTKVADTFEEEVSRQVKAEMLHLRMECPMPRAGRKKATRKLDASMEFD